MIILEVLVENTLSVASDCFILAYFKFILGGKLKMLSHSEILTYKHEKFLATNRKKVWKIGKYNFYAQVEFNFSHHIGKSLFTFKKLL